MKKFLHIYLIVLTSLACTSQALALDPFDYNDKLPFDGWAKPAPRVQDGAIGLSDSQPFLPAVQAATKTRREAYLLDQNILDVFTKHLIHTPHVYPIPSTPKHRVHLGLVDKQYAACTVRTSTGADRGILSVTLTPHCPHISTTLKPLSFPERTRVLDFSYGGLKNNHLQNSANHILDMINPTYISHLNLSNNHFSTPLPFLLSLLGRLHPFTLTHLDISNNKLSPEGFNNTLQYLTTSKIKSLNVSLDYGTDQSQQLKALIAFRLTNPFLTHLYLGFRNTSTQEAQSTIARALYTTNKVRQTTGWPTILYYVRFLKR